MRFQEILKVLQAIAWVETSTHTQEDKECILLAAQESLPPEMLCSSPSLRSMRELANKKVRELIDGQKIPSNNGTGKGTRVGRTGGNTGAVQGAPEK